MGGPFQTGGNDCILSPKFGVLSWKKGMRRARWVARGGSELGDLDVLHGAIRSVYQAVLHIDVVPQHHSSAWGLLQKGLHFARVLRLGPNGLRRQGRAHSDLDVHGGLRSRAVEVLLHVALVVLRAAWRCTASGAGFLLPTIALPSSPHTDQSWGPTWQAWVGPQDRIGGTRMRAGPDRRMWHADPHGRHVDWS